MNIGPIRKKRLKQLAHVAGGGLLSVTLMQVLYGLWFDAFVLGCATLAMGAIYRLIYINRLDWAANGLIGLLFFTIMVMIFTGLGLRDEAVFALPGLIVFSTMTGRLALTYTLIAIIIVLCLFMGVGYSLDYLTVAPMTNSFETGFSFAMIFAASSYAIVVSHKDLVKAGGLIQAENDRFKASQEQIEFIAHHDDLTNLPNRLLAKDRFEHALLKNKRNQRQLAILYLDLDDFKSVNDTLGHESGDHLLVQVAKRLGNITRQNDTICRLGGDEFLIIVEDLTDTASISNLASKILNTLAQEYQLSGSIAHCSASIGIALAPSDADSFEGILKNADLAMYNAKDLGRNTFCFFNNEQQRILQDRLDLTAQMRTAIQNNELTLLYQPKVDLNSERIIGAEALLRWHNGAFGAISPEQFIPMAEQNGLIGDIGRWVLETACRDTGAFLSILPSFHISVNVSVAQFKNTNLAAEISALLARYHLVPTVMDIEITESILAEQVSDVRNNLAGLRQLGVSLSIDDFGTGYSNLAYLKNFDVQTLKIDLSFIQDLAHNQHNQTIVKAILQICKGLDMTAVAEGVEDQQTLALLQSWQCDMAQGFYWSKPITKAALLTRLANDVVA
ncbi:putative bifunctional diguanylate cyclase/phosphodiesterase [Reinekea sp.]|uniref:putative bifunctional diguanylate cyclase/phosphodiesterase n=1 Tax=Reinekea sp. TaxID=1970455 RepID=UPI002A80DD2B|nr:EAL domain-containing protein [Reinekea sp.]